MSSTQSTQAHIDTLTQRILAAAQKVGIDAALRSARACIIKNNGKFFIDYEPPVLGSSRKIDSGALDRAQAWLDRATNQST